METVTHSEIRAPRTAIKEVCRPKIKVKGAPSPTLPAPEVKLTCIDWLEIMCRCEAGTILTGGEAMYEIGRFQFSWLRQTKLWRNIYEVYHDGELFGTIATTPKSLGVLKGDEVMIKVDNAVLYTEFADRLLQLVKELQAEFLHVSQLDISADGYNLLLPLNETMKERAQRVQVGGRQVMQHRSILKNKTFFFNWFKIGSEQSEKQLRVYDKSSEAKMRKPYIIQWWKLNGLENTENVERLELVLKSQYLRHIFQKDYICPETNPHMRLANILSWVRDSQFHVDVLTKYLAGMYQFRDLSNSQIKRCAPIFVLKFTLCLIEQKLWRPVKALSTVVKRVSDGVYSTKLAIKNLTQWAHKTGNNAFQALAQDLANNTYLNTYLEERKRHWVYEVQLKHKNKLPFLNFFDFDRGGVPIRAQAKIVNLDSMLDHLQMVRMNINESQTKTPVQ